MRPEDLDLGLLRLFLPHMDEMELERDRRWEEIPYRLAELYTAHNAAVTLAAADSSWRCLAVYYHFIDWICHGFMAYRPPQRSDVSEEDVRFYGSVVDAAYKVQDFLLADLLQHAGPDVTLLLTSDHGFQSDHLRPTQTPDVTAGIADWHRPHGMIVVAGPKIQSGQTIEGANILDVAPTLLHLLDLPVGEDMDGRALFEVTEDPKRPDTIASWETALGEWWHPRNDGGPGDATEEEEVELLQQFVDLGYMEMPSNPHEDLVEMTERENAFNLGISLLGANLPGEALPHLWQAHAQLPETPHYAFHLARALADLGLGPEAEAVLDVVRDFGENHPVGRRLRGQIAFQLGDHEAASGHFDAVAGAGKGDAALQKQRGFLALQRGQFAQAEDNFRTVLVSDEDDASAWLGLARAFARQNHYLEAAAAARRALGLKRELPLAHLTLAQASEAAGDCDAAAEAYAEALRLEPNLENSRDGLLRLHPLASEETQDRVLAHLARARSSPTPNGISPGQARAQFLRLQEEQRTKTAERRATREPVDVYDFRPPTAIGTSGKTFYIVSGLPRSGTSMMMQMLASGGLAPMTDGLREADPDNPRGYYEWEAVKRLAQNPAIIEESEERAVKVISAQLGHLPRAHSYRIIFMRRPAEEIVQSQRAMLDRLQKPGSGHSLEAIGAALLRHEKATLEALRARPEIALLELNYHDVLQEPEKTAARVGEFLGADRLPSAGKMGRAVDASLHRQRIQK